MGIVRSHECLQIYGTRMVQFECSYACGGSFESKEESERGRNRVAMFTRRNLLDVPVLEVKNVSFRQNMTPCAHFLGRGCC